MTPQQTAFGPVESGAFGNILAALTPGEWFYRTNDEDGPFVLSVDEMRASIESDPERHARFSCTIVKVQWNATDTAGIVAKYRRGGEEVDPACDLLLHKSMVFRSGEEAGA